MRVRRLPLAAVALAAVSSGLGCARFGGPPGTSPPPWDPEAELRSAERHSRIEGAGRLTFTWSAREPDFRGSGMGVARVEPPDRVRLDLFLDNGETAAAAALVGDELRLPGRLPLELVPPPPLMWAALGVFRPGEGMRLLDGRRADGGQELHLRLPGGPSLRYRLRGGRVVEAAVLQGSSVAERVSVSASRDRTGYPEEATYRNLVEYRELKLKLESVEDVETFPPHIWNPGTG